MLWLHALANLPVGQVGFTEGPALAAVNHFKTTVRRIFGPVPKCQSKAHFTLNRRSFEVLFVKIDFNGSRFTGRKQT